MRRSRRWRLARTCVVVAILLVVGIAALLANPSHRQAASTGSKVPARPPVPRVRLPAWSTVPLSDLPPASSGSLPLTTTEPTAATAAFRAEMRVLWDAVKAGDPAGASAAFFPEAAYLQVKALSNDAVDYTRRLVSHYQLDIAAAHQLLGAGAATAHLLKVLVPQGQAAWIPPGACYNKLGYWHVPGSRMVYEEGGQVRSFGITSLISWRDYWYVVHLGAVYPPPGQGVVDSPSIGTGAFGPPGGC